MPGDLHEQERCAPFEAHDLDVHVRERVGPTPELDERDGVLHVAVALPVGVEGRRLVGNPDVLHQLGNDGRVPELVDEALCDGAVHGSVLRGRCERLL